ncbi:trypsin-like protein serine protease DegP-like protein [Psychroflexus torquis ATCC 700755]|uniref:Trypsin-like protein serine protease DegP-like protein n=2 Tax=Psychroflexus TaxID=83612 RepID=K4ILC4_PSYTT|nr:trypsin-like protein serine protease DegP-like protein [Psychroflexus torquis ATCC 700755]
MRKPMIRNLLVFIAIVLPLFVFAQVSSSNFAKSSVVYIQVSSKKTNGKVGLTHGTGWAWSWNSELYVVTALHVVAGMETITVRLANKFNERSSATLVKTFKKADLALLKLDRDIGLVPLDIDTVDPNSKPSLMIWGYPLSSRKINGKAIEFSYSLEKEPTLNSMLLGLNRKYLSELKEQGFPLLDVNIFQVETTITHGHSGAPIINDKGKVIGIANGGLKNGIYGLNWAIPSKYLPELANSQENSPNKVSIQGILLSGEVEVSEDTSEEEIYSYFDREEINSTINGGNGSELHRTWVASLEDIAYTMDDEDISAINDMIELEYIDLKDTFDVYEDYNTGITYAVPSGYEVNFEDDMYSVEGNDFTFGFSSVSNVPFNQANNQIDLFVDDIIQSFPDARISENLDDSFEMNSNDKTLDKIIYREVYFEGENYLLSVGGTAKGTDVGFIFIISRLPREMNYDELREYFLFTIAMSLFSLS